MPAEVIQNIYLNYGVIGLVIISFFVLLVWTVKSSKDREDRLYKIIDTLSEQLPEIRNALEDIKKQLTGEKRNERK